MPPCKRPASGTPRAVAPKTSSSRSSAPAGSRQLPKRASALASSWQARCVHEFGLTDFDRCTTVADEVKNASHATEEIWEAYYKQRSEHREYLLAAGKKADDDLDGDEGCDDRIRAEIKNDIKKLLKQKGFSNRLLWEKHIYVLCPTDSCWEDWDTVRSVDLLAYVYSPLVLPRCIQLHLCYHKRARAYSIEYYMGVYFKLLTPGGPTEERQELFAKMTSEDWSIDDGVPFVPSKGELICGNSYEDPPDAGLSNDRDCHLWTEVEAIDTSNYTPGTVRRIRSWLLASTSSASVSLLISDFELMKMLLAAAGTANSRIDLGYYWPQTSEQSEAAKARLKADGVWEEVGKRIERVSWLDHQTRLATCSQKIIDSYYQPYDAVDAKAAWGKSVLEVLETIERNDNSEGEDEAEDKEEMASLHKAPHLVWALAKQNSLPWRRNQALLMDILSSRFRV